MTLFKSESLCQPEVPVLLHRPAERIARNIPEYGPSGSRGVGRIECRRKATRIQIVIQSLLPSAGGVKLRRSARAGKRCRAATQLAKNAAARAVGNRERQAALISDNPADGPATEELILEKAVLRNRKIVGITHDQAMRTIKITAS